MATCIACGETTDIADAEDATDDEEEVEEEEDCGSIDDEDPPAGEIGVDVAAPVVDDDVVAVAALLEAFVAVAVGVDVVVAYRIMLLAW